MRLLRSCFGLIFLLLVVLPSCGTAFGADTVFRISGVVLNSRDGAPVARCKVSAEPSGSAVGSAPNRGGRAQQRPGFAPGGRGPGARGGGFNRSDAATTPADGETAITDVRGTFSLTVPHAGMWRLTGVARGFRSQSYDEHEGYTSAIVLTAAAPEMALSFRLTPDAIISGIVFNEAGEPVRQAQVRTELLAPGTPGRTPAPQIAGFAQTDDRGRYEVAGLAPGAYRLGVVARPWYAIGAGAGRGALFSSGGAARGDGAASPLDPSLDVVYPSTWFPAALDADSAETIELKPGEERQADVHLTPIPSIHLKIPRTDQSTSGDDRSRRARPPMVSSTSSNFGFIGPNQVTASANEWDVGGLAPGTYQVRLPNGDDATSVVQLKIGPGSASVVGLEGALPSIKVSITIDGVPDRSVDRVMLTDVDSGQVYTSNQRRAERGQRALVDGEGENDDDADQTRTILVPAHRYEVSVVSAEGVFLTGIQAADAKVTGLIADITGGAPTLAVHAATGRAELRGIANLAGKPAVGAMVLLVPSTYGQPGTLTEVSRDETNTDGSFVLQSLIPGQYILVAIDHGWSVNWRDAATLGQYLTAGTPVQLRSSAHEHLEIEAVAP